MIPQMGDENHPDELYPPLPDETYSGQTEAERREGMLPRGETGRKRSRKVLSLRQRDLLFLDFDRWGYDRKGWRKQTRRTYYVMARHVDDWLTEHRGMSLLFASPKDLMHFMFEGLRDNRTGMPAKPSTRNGYRAALRAFGEYLVDKEMRDVNPALSLERLSVPRSLPKALSPQVIQTLEAAVPILGTRHMAMFSVFAYCGLRQTELRLLEWVHIHDDRCLRDFEAKGGHERVVPVHPKAWKVLERWRVESDSPRWVFPSTRHVDRPISAANLKLKVREMGELVGIKGLHPHLFRHTVATQMLENGADTRDVQEFLGHASLATTQIYTKVRPRRLREAVNRLDYSSNGEEERET